jgi:hypothetical protein
MQFGFDCQTAQAIETVIASNTPGAASRLAARGARGLRELSRLERGRGECRMRAAPAVPCANWIEKTHTSIQVQRRRSDIPCAMALRLITRSPRRRIRLVTVIGELTEYPRPVGPTLLRRFDTSNGCRNHTTSPYAATSFVCALLIAHGSGSIQNPPCHHVSRLTLPRPPHPAPRL